MKDVMEAVSEFSVVDLYPSIGVLEVSYRVQEKNDKLHGEVDWILENIVTDPRDKITVGGGGGEDLVDILLRLQKQNDLQYPLSDSVVKAIILVVPNGNKPEELDMAESFGLSFQLYPPCI
ncbi:hypothetical protein AAHE18_07G017500 [Arachis hypogaea]